MKKVFLSYARKDGRTHVEKLDMALRERGYQVWWDQRDIDPAQDFTAEIENGIKAADYVVAIITTDAVRDNSFVRREIGYAGLENKPIIVARFENISPPVHVATNTFAEFHKFPWNNTFSMLCDWLERPTGTPKPAVVDPFHEHLRLTYDAIVQYLTQTMFTSDAIPLTGIPDPDRVNAPRQANPLSSFFMAKGLNDPDKAQPERFDHFAEAVRHYAGRVLLLGDPGAGKTTTLLAHIRDAIAARLDDPTAPLPILKRATEWDALKALDIADWMAEGIPGAESEIAAGRVLLLIDGLDELGDRRERMEKQPDPENPEIQREVTITFDPRPLFVARIPAENQVIITCRVKDYDDMVQSGNMKAALRGAVTLQPLSDAQIAAYLSDAPGVYAALTSDPDLLALARTPLLLSLIAFAFRDAPDDLRGAGDLSAGEFRDFVFSRYIEQRYEHERLRHTDQTLPFSLDDVRDGLGHVAMRDAVGMWKWKPNVFFARDFALKNARLTSFIILAETLHLLVAGDRYVDDDHATWRFRHLLLRDHLGYEHSLKALYNDDANVRVTAAEVLGRIGDMRAVGPLIEVLRDDDVYSVRSTAAEALGRIGDMRAVGPLIEVLRDDEVKVRRATIKALGQIGDMRAVGPLIEVLRDDDANVRVTAAEVLTWLQWQPDTLEQKVALAIAYQHWDHLIEIGMPAVASLISILHNTDANMRQAVTEALGKIGTPAVAPLIDILSDGEANVCHAAIDALGEIGKPAVIPLIDALGDVEVCGNAAEALGRIGDMRAVGPLIEVLRDDDANVRYVAAMALGRIGDMRAVGPLIEVLRDDDVYSVRSTAAEALGLIDTPEALEAVKNYLRGQL